MLLGLLIVPPLVMLPLPRLALPSYYLPSAAAYLALKALILARPVDWRATALGLGAATLMAVVGLTNLYMGREYQRAEFTDDWRSVAREIAGIRQPGDLIVANHPSLGWYLERQGVAVRDASSVAGSELAVASRVITEFSPLSGYSDANAAAATDLERRLAVSGFTSVLVLRYNRDPDAERKRRLVKRAFPEYRTVVTVYGRRADGEG